MEDFSRTYLEMRRSQCISIRSFFLFYPTDWLWYCSFSWKSCKLLFTRVESPQWNPPWRSEGAFKLRGFNKMRQLGELNWASIVFPTWRLFLWLSLTQRQRHLIQIMPQNIIADLNFGITFIVLFSQEKSLRWKEINTHTCESARERNFFKIP